jgi:hypothetical protein
MMYFFSEIFFIHTSQNFKKSATIWLWTVLVEMMMMMMMADLQTSATSTTKMVRASFVIISSRKMKTMDEGKVDRRSLVFKLKRKMVY